MNAPKPKLAIDTTRERLVSLGSCTHAAEHLDHVLSDAVRQEMAPHAFLDLLLETASEYANLKGIGQKMKIHRLAISHSQT